MTIPYADRYGGGFIDSPSQASPIDAQFLNAVEDALVALCGTSPAASKVPVWNNSTQQFEPGYPPGYELAYAEQTSNVTGITGTTFAGGTQIVSAGSVTFDGTAVWIEFSSEGVSNSAGGNKTFFDLSQDGTSIGTIAVKTHPSANNGDAVLVRRRLTPAAGAHTYLVKAFVSAGTSQVNGGAGGASTVVPAYIRITKA
jgi:hypothetical protein